MGPSGGEVSADETNDRSHHDRPAKQTTIGLEVLSLFDQESGRSPPPQKVGHIFWRAAELIDLLSAAVNPVTTKNQGVCAQTVGEAKAHPLSL